MIVTFTYSFSPTLTLIVSFIKLPSTSVKVKLITTSSPGKTWVILSITSLVLFLSVTLTGVVTDTLAIVPTTTLAVL